MNYLHRKEMGRCWREAQAISRCVAYSAAFSGAVCYAASLVFSQDEATQIAAKNLIFYSASAAKGSALTFFVEAALELIGHRNSRNLDKIFEQAQGAQRSDQPTEHMA